MLKLVETSACSEIKRVGRSPNLLKKQAYLCSISATLKGGTVVSLPSLLSICYALGADANSIVGSNLPGTVKIAHINKLLEILASNQFDIGTLEQIVLLVKQIQALQNGEST